VERLPIVVYSHLGWNSVYQRPHQIVSRISERRPVLFLEETVAADPLAPDSAELQYPFPNLTVVRPILQTPRGPFDPERLGVLGKRLLRWQHATRHIAWLYTPLALPLAQALSPDRIVYDCMDELGALLHAPPDLAEREQDLLDAADLVFCGGPSLYRARRDRHPRVRCFPSSVDVAHFRPAPGPHREPPDQSALARPRLGFFGVIDERLDLGLLDGLAALRPDWQIVLIGPVSKIDEASLPRRHNLHYLGQRSYASLPRYLTGWDVCLMPFAQSRATRCISPTKTLEYMAAEKPVVTTPIRDVVDSYGDAVEVASDAAGFVAACERLMAEGPSARARRVTAMRELVGRTSWDDTVQAMLDEIHEVSHSETLGPEPLRWLEASRVPAVS